MDNFYFFTLFCIVIFALKKEVGFLFLLLGGFYFLATLPTTNLDYEVYKEAYERSFFTSEYPWFKTNTRLTAEPFYLWYNSFLGVLLPISFKDFLGVNFIICVAISFKAMISLIKKESLFFFWIFLLPVIFPTIFYFSPRSSISFFLILLGFTFLVKNKLPLAIIALGFGINTHSQFLLVTTLLLVTFFTIKFIKSNQQKKHLKIVFIYAIILFLLLKFIDLIVGNILSILSFLPSFAIIDSKMSYLEGGRTGFRITGILSIIVYPYLAYKFLDKVNTTKSTIFFKKDKIKEINFTFLVFSLIIYGAVINLAFLTEPHVAGRLSRFSDYIGMGFILPLYLRFNLKNNLVYFFLILLGISAPFIYGTLYSNVNWGF